MQFLRYHHHLILESVENEILIFFFLSNYFQILMMISISSYIPKMNDIQ